MAKNPIEYHSDAGLSEATEYLIDLIVPAIGIISTKLEASSSDAEEAKQALQLLSDELTNLVTTVNSLMDTVGILELNNVKLRQAIVALAEKLDSEDVANLDADYLVEVNNNLD